MTAGAPMDDWAQVAFSVAAGLRVDMWTAEVAAALQERGVRYLLLKGPTTARWLYAADPWSRSYVDVDLLVPPEDFRAAKTVLRQLSFVAPADPEWKMLHAQAWTRPSDGATVDLHRTLHCLETRPAEEVWAEMNSEAETCDIRGVAVAVPGVAARLLHVALHVRLDEDPSSKPAEDLRRAVGQVGLDSWQKAAKMARRLGAEADMGVRLSQTEAGRRLSGELGLPATGSRRSYLISDIEHGRMPGSVYMMSVAASQPTYWAKLRWVVERQFPARRCMEEWYPIARRGRLGLTAAYVLRLARDTWRLPAAVYSWIRFTRRMKRSTSGR